MLMSRGVTSSAVPPRDDLGRVAAVQAHDHRGGIDHLNPTRQVGHQDAAGHDVLGIGIVSEEISFLPPADAVDRPVTGEVDDDDFRRSCLFRQPL